MRAQPKASHFINGRFVEDKAGKPLDVIYPATGEIIAKLFGATPALIEQAVQAAAAAQPAWAALKPVERGRILRRAADLLRARNAEIAELETLDTGKAIQETLVADPASAADALEFYGGIIAGFNGEMIELGGSYAYTRREALGVCVGIGAWNYPIQGAGWKSAPALAAGNAMIFKPSENTPLSALALAEIYREAGLPDGLFNVLQGFGDVGSQLVDHPLVAKVSLTGSVPTGKKVLAQAGSHMKHVCSNGTRVFVQKGIKDRFLDRLVTRTKAIRLGDPLDPEIHLGPLINAAQRDKVVAYIEKGKAEGATLAFGGGVPKMQGFEGGCYVEPTIFTGVTDGMTIAQEEIFGPVMAVLDFNDEDEVVARANDTEFGLSAGVFTKDLSRAHRVISQLKAGTCWINTYNLAPVEMPFGGFKQSGVGRENGLAALYHYSQIKSVYVETGKVESPY
eukprot:gene10606-12996_t